MTVFHIVNTFSLIDAGGKAQTICGAPRSYTECSKQAYNRVAPTTTDIEWCPQCVDRLPLVELADCDLEGTQKSFTRLVIDWPPGMLEKLKKDGHYKVLSHEAKRLTIKGVNLDLETP